MTVTLEDLNKQAEEIQRRMDTISNLLKLAAMSDRITELQAIKRHMGQVGLEISEESEKLSDMMSEFKEEKRKMRFAEKALLVIVLMLLLAFTVSAQDASLATNTPDAAAILPVVATVDGAPVEATVVAPDAQPPVVVVNSEPSDRTIYVIGAIIVGVFTIISQLISHQSLKNLTATVSKTLENKQILDEATQRYMQSSMQVQQFVQVAVGIAGLLGSTIPGDDLAERLKKFGDQVIAGANGPGTAPDMAGNISAGVGLTPFE